MNDQVCFGQTIMYFTIFMNTWVRLVFQQTEESQEAYSQTHTHAHITHVKSIAK